MCLCENLDIIKNWVKNMSQKTLVNTRQKIHNNTSLKSMQYHMQYNI